MTSNFQIIHMGTTRVQFRGRHGSNQKFGLEQVGQFTHEQAVNAIKNDAIRKIREYQEVVDAPDIEFEVEHVDPNGTTVSVPWVARPMPSRANVALTNTANTSAGYGLGSKLYDMMQGVKLDGATGTLVASGAWTAPIGSHYNLSTDLSESSEGYTDVLSGLEMSAYGFTDSLPGFWYRSWEVSSTADITLELSIMKSTGEYEVEILDNSETAEDSQPVMYGTLPPEERDLIVNQIEDVLKELRGWGLNISINHAEYGYTPEETSNV